MGFSGYIISASLEPILHRRQLRLEARAFTCMLRMLQTEITHNFQHKYIQSVAGWLRFVAKKGTHGLTTSNRPAQYMLSTGHPGGYTRSAAGGNMSSTGRYTTTHQN